MNPCTKALYVSLIIRCDSAAMVANTSELLPEPDTPVKAVSRRFGSSTLTSLRLFTRAPCTRIRSWVSAVLGPGFAAAGFVAALLIVTPPSGRVGTRATSLKAPRWLGHHGGDSSGTPGRSESALGGDAQSTWLIRIMLPAGSRTAASRMPYGWSVGSWTTSTSLAASCVEGGVEVLAGQRRAS